MTAKRPTQTPPTQPAVLTLSIADALRLRMYAQGLIERPTPEGHRAIDRTGAERVADVTRRMFALQGQDWRASQWALGVRDPRITQQDVHDAFNSGSIVRSWPMRGTVHVVAAEDIGWMQQVASRRPLAGAPKRREYLGISDTVLDRLVGVAHDALAGGNSLNRDELAETWSEAGIQWQSNWRYHLIWWMCQTGITLLGPIGSGESASAGVGDSGAVGAGSRAAGTKKTGGDEPRLVLASEWITAPRTLTGDEALSEFATRFTAARGPVQVSDLAWWAGVTKTEAKRAIALAAEAGNLQQVSVRDAAGETHTGYWCTAEQVEQVEQHEQHDQAEQVEQPGWSDESPDAPEWQLLPAFDEHLLGYTDRSAQLDPAHFERIVPGRNGMFLATVTYRGRTVATWKRAGTAKRPAVRVTPLPATTAAAWRAGLAEPLAKWAAFHGMGETALEVAEVE